MSAWRRVALEKLPELRNEIEAADNPMAMWIELRMGCEEAYDRRDEDLIRRFYDFARWCWESPSAEVRTAVAFGFCEHVPETPSMRQDMPRRFNRVAFNELREVFQYHLSPDEFSALEQEFLEGEKKHPKPMGRLERP